MFEMKDSNGFGFLCKSLPFFPFDTSLYRCSLMFRGSKIEELCGIQWRERVFAKTGISWLYFMKLISSSPRRTLDWQTA